MWLSPDDDSFLHHRGHSFAHLLFILVVDFQESCCGLCHLVLVILRRRLHLAERWRVWSDDSNPYLVSAADLITMALPCGQGNGSPPVIGGDDKGRLILVLRMRLNEFPQFLYELIRLPGRLQVSIIMSAMGKIVSLTISDIHHPWCVLFHIFQRIMMRECIEPH